MEDNLRCSNCSERYDLDQRLPRILHDICTYCTVCLKKFPVDDGTVLCPECVVKVKLPDGGIMALAEDDSTICLVKMYGDKPKEQTFLNGEVTNGVSGTKLEEPQSSKDAVVQRPTQFWCIDCDSDPEHACHIMHDVLPLERAKAKMSQILASEKEECIAQLNHSVKIMAEIRKTREMALLSVQEIQTMLVESSQKTMTLIEDARDSVREVEKMDAEDFKGISKVINEIKTIRLNHLADVNEANRIGAIYRTIMSTDANITFSPLMSSLSLSIPMCLTPTVHRSQIYKNLLALCCLQEIVDNNMMGVTKRDIAKLYENEGRLSSESKTKKGELVNGQGKTLKNVFEDNEETVDIPDDRPTKDSVVIKGKACLQSQNVSVGEGAKRGGKLDLGEKKTDEVLNWADSAAAERNVEMKDESKIKMDKGKGKNTQNKRPGGTNQPMVNAGRPRPSFLEADRPYDKVFPTTFAGYPPAGMGNHQVLQPRGRGLALLGSLRMDNHYKTMSQAEANYGPFGRGYGATHKTGQFSSENQQLGFVRNPESKIRVYLDFSVNGEPFGCATFVLDKLAAPRMVENFVALCNSSRYPSYRMSKIVKNAPNVYIEGGEAKKDETFSTFGGLFHADSSPLRDCIGAIRMKCLEVQERKPMVGNIFAIWAGEKDFKPHPQTTVFGRVNPDGMDLIRRLSRIDSWKANIRVSNCGLA